MDEISKQHITRDALLLIATLMEACDVFGDSSKGLLVQRRLWKRVLYYRVFVRGYLYSDAYGSAYCIMIQIRDNHSLALLRLGFETGT